MSGPFFCQSCGQRSAFPLQHKNLGWICQHCLRPLIPRKKRRRSMLPSLGQGYYADLLGRRPHDVIRGKTARLLKVAERDGWICQLCGEPVEKRLGRHRPSVDHIIRQRAGGSDALSNLRLAHQSCNEYREGANVQPFAPFIEPFEDCRVSPVPYPGGER